MTISLHTKVQNGRCLKQRKQPKKVHSYYPLSETSNFLWFMYVMSFRQMMLRSSCQNQTVLKSTAALLR
ncbi:UNVERIFIED_CONTAM: hypothetical protein GTU68_061836 [Idotea baltica]|nr:hypothetical protein [Idotea baltica]